MQVQTHVQTVFDSSYKPKYPVAHSSNASHAWTVFIFVRTNLRSLKSRNPRSLRLERTTFSFERISSTFSANKSRRSYIQTKVIIVRTDIARKIPSDIKSIWAKLLSRSNGLWRIFCAITLMEKRYIYGFFWIALCSLGDTTDGRRSERVLLSSQEIFLHWCAEASSSRDLFFISYPHSCLEVPSWLQTVEGERRVAEKRFYSL